jgi:hypothetical protein
MTVGVTVVGIVSVVISIGKAREIANKPVDDAKRELSEAIAVIRHDVHELRKELDGLNVHFDPKGGDVRGKLALIEKRLVTVESASSNERAELKGLILDLRPILHELRERA